MAAAPGRRRRGVARSLARTDRELVDQPRQADEQVRRQRLLVRRKPGEEGLLAVVLGAGITLLTAVARPPYWATSPATAAAVQPLSDDLAREARNTLTATIDRIPESIPVTSVLSEKPIRDAIMDRLADGHHDLLVMGSRGRGAPSARCSAASATTRSTMPPCRC